MKSVQILASACLLAVLFVSGCGEKKCTDYSAADCAKYAGCYVSGTTCTAAAKCSDITSPTADNCKGSVGGADCTFKAAVTTATCTPKTAGQSCVVSTTAGVSGCCYAATGTALATCATANITDCTYAGVSAATCS